MRAPVLTRGCPRDWSAPPRAAGPDVAAVSRVVFVGVRCPSGSVVLGAGQAWPVFNASPPRRMRGAI
eukprot:2195639-Lingulodinium_polyedra.AAC.1